jgi:hypothetical protein
MKADKSSNKGISRRGKLGKFRDVFQVSERLITTVIYYQVFASAFCIFNAFCSVINSQQGEEFVRKSKRLTLATDAVCLAHGRSGFGHEFQL